MSGRWETSSTSWRYLPRRAHWRRAGLATADARCDGSDSEPLGFWPCHQRPGRRQAYPVMWGTPPLVGDAQPLQDWVHGSRVREALLTMNRTHYILRPKSGAWTGHPSRSDANDYQILGFDMTVEYDGKRLGGNNIQLALGGPDSVRRGLDEDVVMWLSSGWWVSLRNQFSAAPCVAMEVLNSVADELSSITVDATEARGSNAAEVSERLFATTFTGEGPAYWS
jgi:hypothetical protein